MNQEDLIWDRITQSAMSKFPFAEFKQELESSTDHEQVAENIVFMSIIGFASGKDEHAVAESIYNQIILTGFIWDFGGLEKFLSDKKQLWHLEVYAANLAYTLLEESKDPAVALAAVNQLL
jgi:hypothetical protein